MYDRPRKPHRQEKANYLPPTNTFYEYLLLPDLLVRSIPLVSGGPHNMLLSLNTRFKGGKCSYIKHLPNCLSKIR